MSCFRYDNSGRCTNQNKTKQLFLKTTATVEVQQQAVQTVEISAQGPQGPPFAGSTFFDTNAIATLTSSDTGTLLTWNGSTYAPSNVLTRKPHNCRRRVLNVYGHNQDKTQGFIGLSRGAWARSRAESWHSTRFRQTRNFITAMATMAAEMPRQSFRLPVKTSPTVALQIAVSLSTETRSPWAAR